MRRHHIETKNAPHEYEKPKNKFEVRMNCAASAILGNESSPYYLEETNKGCLERITDEVIALQTVYDAVSQRADQKTQKAFHRILKKLTNNAFRDEHGDDIVPDLKLIEPRDDQDVIRLSISDISFDLAIECLEDECIPCDIDANGYLTIRWQDLDDTKYLLENAGIVYDIRP